MHYGLQMNHIMLSSHMFELFSCWQ